MNFEQKLKILRLLEEQGVVRENCPVPNASGGTAYWPFQVMRPQELPSTLLEEYRKNGEVRV